MTNLSGNYRVQSSVAREAGTGGPGQRPGSSDKRVAIFGLAAIVAGIAALLLFV